MASTSSTLLGRRLDHLKQFGVQNGDLNWSHNQASACPPSSTGGSSASRPAPEPPPGFIGDPILEVGATLEDGAGLFTNFEMIF